MQYQALKVEIRDGVGTITVDRPKVLNAIDRSTMGELQNAFDAYIADPAVRVIVFTGAGERAFISGGDINDEIKMNGQESYEFSRRGHNLILTMEKSPKPIIAAINGYALGGGMELCMGADFRIASENAKFGVPEIKLGVTCGFGGTQMIPRLMGITKAKELLMLGDMIDAQEAYRLGLLNKVVPLASLKDEVMDWAARLSKLSMVSLSMSKYLIDRGMQCDMYTARHYESTAFGFVGASADKLEGMGAYIEKRDPKFIDK